jgi:hypothetical protein
VATADSHLLFGGRLAGPVKRMSISACDEMKRRAANAERIDYALIRACSNFERGRISLRFL